MKRVLVALGAVVLTAGCSFGGDAGAAAVVGGKDIKASEVASHVDAVRHQIENSDPEVINDIPGMTLISRMIVDRLILEDILSYAAKDLDITISNADVAIYRDNIYKAYGEEAIKGQLLTSQGVRHEDVDKFMYDIMLQKTIIATLAPGQPESIGAPVLYKYLSTIVEKQGVKVAPRYGSWDPLTMQTAANENFLSTTTVAADPAVTP